MKWALRCTEIVDLLWSVRLHLGLCLELGILWEFALLCWDRDMSSCQWFPFKLQYKILALSIPFFHKILMCQTLYQSSLSYLERWSVKIISWPWRLLPLSFIGLDSDKVGITNGMGVHWFYTSTPPAFPVSNYEPQLLLKSVFSDFQVWKAAEVSVLSLPYRVLSSLDCHYNHYETKLICFPPKVCLTWNLISSKLTKGNLSL